MRPDPTNLLWIIIDLSSNVLTSPRDDLQRDGCAERARQADNEPRQVERRRDVSETNNLGCDGANGGPVSSGHCTSHDGEEEQNHPCRRAGHVNASCAVTEISNEGTTNSLTQVEDGADHGRVGSIEAYKVGVVRQAEDEDDVSQHTEPAISEKQVELDSLEKPKIERDLARAYDLVAVFDKDSADDVDDKDENTENPIRPCETDVSNDCPSCQGRSTCGEPLGNDADAWDEEEAHSQPEENALREEELVNFGRKASTYQTSSLQDNTAEKSGLGAELANAESSKRGDKHGTCDTQGSDKGIVKRGRTGKRVVCDEMGEEDSVTRIEAPASIGRWWWNISPRRKHVDILLFLFIFLLMNRNLLMGLLCRGDDIYITFFRGGSVLTSPSRTRLRIRTPG
ncbi:hypothetical protein HG530_009713 [Fusarium avenaceum]|nr:hypothetical protein HG530_009713 [Fusarium avenaceum]